MKTEVKSAISGLESAATETAKEVNDFTQDITKGLIAE